MIKTVFNTAPGLQTVIALEDGALHTGTIQDCAPIAKWAKAAHNSGYTGPSADMKFAARVPDVIVEKYLNDNQITLHEFIAAPDHQKRLLNDPAIDAFRVWKGRI